MVSSPLRAAQQGLNCCLGSGRRGEGLVYWIPGREPLLWPGDNSSRAEQEAWRQRCHEDAQLRKEAASA